MSPSKKMTHLQQSVAGKAKSEIAGFRYNGSLYNQAWKRLESRFGKPHTVVQAHLDKLARSSAVMENDATSVSAFSNIVNNIVWTFKSSDVKTTWELQATSGQPSRIYHPPVLLKWNEYVVGGNTHRPTLELLGDWLQKQAEVHELLPVKPKGGGRMDDRRQPPPKDRRRDHPFGSFAAHDDETSSKSCPIDDGQHLVLNCKTFNERVLMIAPKLPRKPCSASPAWKGDKVRENARSRKFAE